MKKTAWFRIASLALLAALCASSAAAADGSPDAETAERLRRLNSAADELRSRAPDRFPEERAGRGERLNQAFVALTGEAVNPLFGVTALGMYRYFTTPEQFRDALPLYDQPAVWLPLLCILLLMLFNSTICEAMPFLKMPLNALGDIVNKAGAVAVLPLVVKLFADQFVAAPEFAAATGLLFPAAFAGEPGVAAAIPSQIGWLLAAAAGFVVYGAVWLTFNVIDVLIIVCPFPGVDAALKSFRLAVAGALAGAGQVSPGAALFLASMVTGMSLFLAGWSFRLSVFGLVFSTDILFFRKSGVDAAGCRAFSCAGLKVSKGIPLRTLGTLSGDASGGLVFSYRPWLVLGRREVGLGGAGAFVAGRGLLTPFLVPEPHRNGWPVLRLPPRYGGQEEAMAERFGLHGVVDWGVGGAVRTWLGELFGGGKSEAGSSGNA